MENVGVFSRRGALGSGELFGSYLETEDLRLDEGERATVNLDQTAAGLRIGMSAFASQDR
jgi:hypothetical protein